MMIFKSMKRETGIADISGEMIFEGDILLLLEDTNNLGDCVHAPVGHVWYCTYVDDPHFICSFNHTYSEVSCKFPPNCKIQKLTTEQQIDSSSSNLINLYNQIESINY